jgi:hypothetical protein
MATVLLHFLLPTSQSTSELLYVAEVIVYRYITARQPSLHLSHSVT